MHRALKCRLFSTRLLFSFDPCALLPLTLHLQMGDESEPVTAPREGEGTTQTHPYQAILFHQLHHQCYILFPRVAIRNRVTDSSFIHSLCSTRQSYLQKD